LLNEHSSSAASFFVVVPFEQQLTSTDSNLTIQVPKEFYGPYAPGLVCAKCALDGHRTGRSCFASMSLSRPERRYCGTIWDP